jgi:hypothetical protein
MSRLSVGQKASRVLQFILGLRDPEIAASLSVHGFTDDDLADGWKKMAALTEGRLGVTVPATLDVNALAMLDAWENKWFPIATASMRARYPEVYQRVFLNLSQTEGPEVMLSVGTFLGRLKELQGTPDGKPVLELLAKRGINDSVIADAEGLLKKLQTVDRGAQVKRTVTPEEETARETALWTWYREWGSIARVVITSRRQLRELGFLDDHGHSTSDPGSEDDAVQSPAPKGTTEAPAPVAIGMNPAQSAPQQRVAAGMPGSSPFCDDETFRQGQ